MSSKKKIPALFSSCPGALKGNSGKAVNNVTCNRYYFFPFVSLVPLLPTLDIWKKHHVRESLQFSHRYQSRVIPVKNLYTSDKQDSAAKEISSVTSPDEGFYPACCGFY